MHKKYYPCFPFPSYMKCNEISFLSAQYEEISLISQLYIKKKRFVKLDHAHRTCSETLQGPGPETEEMAYLFSSKGELQMS